MGMMNFLTMNGATILFKLMIMDLLLLVQEIGMIVVVKIY